MHLVNFVKFSIDPEQYQNLGGYTNQQNQEANSSLHIVLEIGVVGDVRLPLGERG